MTMSHSKVARGKPTQSSSSPAKDETAVSRSGSTTLRSVVERVNPSVLATDKVIGADLSTRKTPFGVIRIPSGSHERISKHASQLDRLETATVTAHAYPSIDSTRLLPPFRQRTRHGRAELHRDGILTFTHFSLCMRLTVTSDLRKAALHHNKEVTSNPFASSSAFAPVNRLTPMAATLYEMAMAWLARYRTKVVVANFLVRRHWNEEEQHRALPICKIHANGPVPDYQVHFELSTRINVQSIDVHVSRAHGRVRIQTSVSPLSRRQDGAAIPWSFHRISLPLTVDGRVSSQDMSTLLSEQEQDSVRRALTTARCVDHLYRRVSDMESHD